MKVSNKLCSLALAATMVIAMPGTAHAQLSSMPERPALNPDYVLKFGVSDQAKADACWDEYNSKLSRDENGNYIVHPIALPAPDSPLQPCPVALITQEDVDAAQQYNSHWLVRLKNLLSRILFFSS